MPQLYVLVESGAPQNPRNFTPVKGTAEFDYQRQQEGAELLFQAPWSVDPRALGRVRKGKESTVFCL